MPVFARTKITIEEDCMPPRPRITLNYSGPNPHKAYPKILEILRNNLKVKDENIQEKDFKWDRSSLPEKFSVVIEVIKDFDKFTHMLLLIKVEGNVKPSKEFEYEGSVMVDVDGVIRTEYPQDSIWERSFLYEMLRTFWHKVFYQDQRFKYREQCRDFMLTIQNEMKAFFNIMQKV